MNHSMFIDVAKSAQSLSQMTTHYDTEYPSEVSPWMADMQLKYFFSQLRQKLYTESLERLHQILHSTKTKHSRTSALVLLLCLATVIEECQHLLVLQAEGRVYRKEEAEWSSKQQTQKLCNNIDEAFEFACKIFHTKYSSVKNQHRVNLKDWPSSMSDPAEQGFMTSLIDLVASERELIEPNQMNGY